MARDIFNDALNDPAGRLAEILIHKIGEGDQTEFLDAMRERLDRLVSTPGRAGLLARVRLARDLPFFFSRAPGWTKERLIPLFEWSSPHAADIWSARKFSSYIGSPELFDLFKKPLLQMFGRSEAAEHLETFADWLVAILIANREDGAGYSLPDVEARAALRKAGPRALTSVAHRLAIEMERGLPDQKRTRWRDVVGSVFQAIWPLDADLQTSSTTFELVRILLTTGDAFPEAADVILPFIRADEPRSQTTVYSISSAPDAFYKSAPAKLLDVVAAVVGEAPPGSVYALAGVLERLCVADPQIADKRKFQKLISGASQHG
jgi:hypothetical protein